MAANTQEIFSEGTIGEDVGAQGKCIPNFYGRMVSRHVQIRPFLSRGCSETRVSDLGFIIV